MKILQSSNSAAFEVTPLLDRHRFCDTVGKPIQERIWLSFGRDGLVDQRFGDLASGLMVLMAALISVTQRREQRSELPRRSIAFASGDAGGAVDDLFVRTYEVLRPIAPAGMAASLVFVGRFQLAGHVHRLAAQVDAGWLVHYVGFVVRSLVTHA